MKQKIADLHISSAAYEPWRLAIFYGKVTAHEDMGHTVHIHEWRDGMDLVYGLVAEAEVPEKGT